jgi:hypothetical protein
VKLGGGYMTVKLLWSRKAGTSEPDALVLGDYGGSGGDADLFAVTVSPSLSTLKLGGERFDEVTVRPDPGPLRLNLPFDIEYFNGAPHAGAITVPIPVRWAGDDFAVDLTEMTSRTYSQSEVDFRALAMREELAAWARDNLPPDVRDPFPQRLYPPMACSGTPVTALGIIEMMLSGHADQARKLLDRAWPRAWNDGARRLGGEQDFWTDLCKAVTKNPFWQRFGLARLPHADLIELGAKGVA